MGSGSSTAKEELVPISPGGTNRKKESGKEMWNANSQFSKDLKEQDEITSIAKSMQEQSQQLASAAKTTPETTAAANTSRRAPSRITRVDSLRHVDDDEQLNLEDLQNSLRASGRSVDLASQILSDYARDQTGGISLEEFAEWTMDHAHVEKNALATNASTISDTNNLSNADEKQRLVRQEASAHLQALRKKRAAFNKANKKILVAARSKIARLNGLSKVEGFSSLAPDARAKIVQELSIEVHTKGVVLAQQGDHAETMYFIVTGECNIIADGTTVAVLKGNDFFGEAMIYHKGDHRMRTADVVVISDECQVLCLDRHVFRSLCRKNVIDKACQLKLEIIGRERKDDTISKKPI